MPDFFDKSVPTIDSSLLAKAQLLEPITTPALGVIVFRNRSACRDKDGIPFAAETIDDICYVNYSREECCEDDDDADVHCQMFTR